MELVRPSGLSGWSAEPFQLSAVFPMHCAGDDHTRLAYAECHSADNAQAAAATLSARSPGLPIRTAALCRR